MPIKRPKVSMSAASHVKQGPVSLYGLRENPPITAEMPHPSLDPSSCDTDRRVMAFSSSSFSASRKRLQPRLLARRKSAARPWQPCRKCGKAYVQLPTELCNDCDKKLYCAPGPQKIRLDDKRPSLEAEPLVFPASPPQKLNGSSKLGHRGKRDSKALPSIDLVLGPPVVARRSNSETAGVGDGQRCSDRAVGETTRTNAAADASMPEQVISSAKSTIRRKPVATQVQKNGAPVYELPAEVALTSPPVAVEQAGRNPSTERDSLPLRLFQRAQQQLQKRLPLPPAATTATTSSLLPPPPTPPPLAPPPQPPPPRTYLIAQPTRDPQASFAQRVVRDAGGPLAAERQRVLAQELSRARAELECSRRAVRNLNEEMARMDLRKFRAAEQLRLREDHHDQHHQLRRDRITQTSSDSTSSSSSSSTSSSSSSSSSTSGSCCSSRTVTMTTARAEVEVAEERRRRRRLETDYQRYHRQDLEVLEALLKKGEKNPEALVQLYYKLCGRCQGDVQEFIKS